MGAAKGQPPQPRWPYRVDIDVALKVCRRELEAWDIARLHDGTPLFSGGLADSWPAWAVDALAIARIETAVIRSYVNFREREEARRG